MLTRWGVQANEGRGEGGKGETNANNGCNLKENPIVYKTLHLSKLKKSRQKECMLACT